jgi:hypothetical protein
MLLRNLLSQRILVPVVAVLGIVGVGLAGPGNSARPPGAGAQAGGLSVDKCVEVAKGDSFEINILVADVTNLLAWDVLYSYNRNVLEVTARDVRQLLAAQPSSNVFDLSDPVPNSTGTYRLGAADTGGTTAAESGGGVLATLTLRAKSAGISWSALYRADVDGDGTIDIGPTLTALGGAHIGDNNGDSVFDGVITSGQIAVDRECVNPVPTAPAPTGVVVVESSVAPTIQTSTPGVPSDETPTPTPEPGNDGNVPTATSTSVEFTDTRDGGGGSVAGVSSWLAGLLAGSIAIGVVLSYVIYKTARRPA